MIVKAQRILTMKGEPIADGAVRVEGPHLRSVGKAAEIPALPGEEIIELGATVLLPGLINAHCHLDYTHFRGSISPPENFTLWIKSINGLKRHFGTAEYLEAVRKGYGLLAEAGTTSVGNIEAFPEILGDLGAPPLRTWWFLELIDLRSRMQDEEAFCGALRFFEERSDDWLGGFGLSPHAPYTASIELYRLARECSQKYGMPFTTHISESVQEHEMFVHARGDLHDFMKLLGRDCTDCGHGSALSHLVEHGVLGSNCLAVHLNYLQDYDFDIIAGLEMPIVHCPKSHTYFHHARFELEKLRECGASISLATDSLASNTSMDLRSEIREAREHHPEISDEYWLETVTLNPARALGLEGRLGEITEGALADLVAFPWDGVTSPARTVIESRAKPSFFMVNGVRLDPSNLFPALTV